MKYNLHEKMAYELGIQTGKTTIQGADYLTSQQKERLKADIERYASETSPELRVSEPVLRNNPYKNLN